MWALGPVRAPGPHDGHVEVRAAVFHESGGPGRHPDRLRIGAIKRKVYKERGQFAALGHRAKAHCAAGG